VNHPNIQASYPEFIGFWLNLWAKKNDLDVLFEVINAGRDGGISSDFSGAVQEELAYLCPDMIVYYEGSNQFDHTSILELPPGESYGRLFFEQLTEMRNKKISFWEKLYLVQKLKRLFTTLFNSEEKRFLKEPKKPAYNIHWPKGLSAEDPDPNFKGLPLNLNTIVDDLQKITDYCEDNNVLFYLTSFVWLVTPDMVIDNTRVSKDPKRDSYFHGIYGYLNYKNHPLAYNDLRFLVDFQNAVFKNFAKDRGILFYDVADDFPMDQRLFFDAIHMTEEGIRLRSWLTFCDFINSFQELGGFEALKGTTASCNYQAYYQIAHKPRKVSRGDLDCRPEILRDKPSARLPIENIIRINDNAGIQRVEPGVEIVTAPEKGSYAAQMELPFLEEGKTLWIEIECTVEKDSSVSFGVLDAQREKFMATVAAHDVSPNNPLYIEIPLGLNGSPRYLVISNFQEKNGQSSTVTVYAVRYYSF